MKITFPLPSYIIQYIVVLYIQYAHSCCRLQVSSYVSSQDMLHLEAEVKTLHAAVEQIQVTLASPELHRLSLREQLTQRQVKTYFFIYFK